MIRVAIGSDNLGFKLKQELTAFLQEQNDVPVKVSDLGVFNTDPVDYPDIAVKVAESIVSGQCDRGILICGTGIGMAIAANKVSGIRAAQVSDPYQAERARKSNNAQIITMGALTIGSEVAKKLVSIWLKSEFQGGKSAIKVGKINALDDRYRNQSSLSNSVPSNCAGKK